MVAAVEKSKFVYILTRDSETRELVIKGPLEAHKNHQIVFGVAAFDNGVSNPNPVFGALELDFGEVDEDRTGDRARSATKSLALYEVDLGVNSVVRTACEPVERSANHLVAVPGGDKGPGGVLVCSEGVIAYHNARGSRVASAPIPRRSFGEDPDRRAIVVASVVIPRKAGSVFLVQSELGDLFSLSLQCATPGAVSGMTINYFDTLPVSTSLSVLTAGYLFAAAESGNQPLYAFTNAQLAGDALTEMGPDGAPLFRPRPLRNLAQTDQLDSFAPLVKLRVAGVPDSDGAQLFALCGKGGRSTLRSVRHGLQVSVSARQELNLGDHAMVWALKERASDAHDGLIVLAFGHQTSVLGWHEGGLREAKSTGFLTTVRTLGAGLIGDDIMVQVHPGGVRSWREGRPVTDWLTAEQRPVKLCSVNSRQVVVSLSDGAILVFEESREGGGGFLEETERISVPNSIPMCLSVGPAPEGKLRSDVLAVGFHDKTVRIFRLGPDAESSGRELSMLDTGSASPHSVCLADLRGSPTDPAATTSYLCVGLDNGILQRHVLDSLDGSLRNERSRLLGREPVKLARTVAGGQPAVVALSSRSWLFYSYGGRTQLAPMAFGETFRAATATVSPTVSESLLAITAKAFYVLSMDRLGATFHSEVVVPLRHTPRGFAALPRIGSLAIIETDHNHLRAGGSGWGGGEEGEEGPPEADGLLAAAKAGPADVKMATSDGTEEGGGALPPSRAYGAPRGGQGTWGSLLRLYDPQTKATLDVAEAGPGEALFSVTVASMLSTQPPPQAQPGQPLQQQKECVVVVGGAKDLKVSPRSCSGGFISLYRAGTDGKRLTFWHTTATDDIPMALEPFQGRSIIAAVGKTLVLYEIGAKKLLRKCELKGFPNLIREVHVNGDRIYVGDIVAAFHMVRYNPTDNSMTIFADETAPRWVTASGVVDFDTLAGGDKFGNFWVSRLPEGVDENEVGDVAMSHIKWWDRGLLNGAPNKLESVAEFHIGETVTSIERASLQAVVDTEVLVYATLSGTIGCFMPFANREDALYFQTLEAHMRERAKPLLGHDHLAFRGYYTPVKAVVDGDLCDQYLALSKEGQRDIANQMDSHPEDIVKRIEEARARIM
jgi:splicing factor 3B subunit 3